MAEELASNIPGINAFWEAEYALGNPHLRFREMPFSSYLMDSFKTMVNRLALNPYKLYINKRALFNFARNYSKSAIEKRKNHYAAYGLAPETYVLTITDNCNLRCRYCYSNSDQLGSHDINAEAAHALINEMFETFGISFVTISGGETFPKVLSLAEKHPDILFMVYTNGTRIDRNVAKQISRLGNIVPCLSIIGPPEIHDSIRGEGSYSLLMAAVDELRDSSLIWGFSVTESSINIDHILSGELFKLCATFSPYFIRLIPYVRVGRQFDSDYSVTHRDMMHLRRNFEVIKSTCPFPIFDYVNDKSLGIGCMAGGIRYFNISPTLRITPCVFMNRGHQITYNPESNKTNAIDLLVHGHEMVKARELGRSCVDCLMLNPKLDPCANEPVV